MIKVIGFVLILISTILFFNRDIITSYCTYIFLTETITLIEFMKAGCLLGKTYNTIYSQTDYSDFYFYISGTEYKYKFLIKEKRKKETALFINNIGKRGKKAELEYLEIYKNIFIKSAEEYRDFYQKNRKANVLFSVAFALVVTIVII